MKFVLVWTIFILLINGMGRVNELMVKILIDREWHRDQEAVQETVQETFEQNVEDAPPVTISDQAVDPMTAAEIANSMDNPVLTRPTLAVGDEGAV